jgi:hypothetical protein
MLGVGGGTLALGALAAGAVPVAGVLAVSLGVSAILTLNGLGAYFGTRIGT